MYAKGNCDEQSGAAVPPEAPSSSGFSVFDDRLCRIRY